MKKVWPKNLADLWLQLAPTCMGSIMNPAFTALSKLKTLHLKPYLDLGSGPGNNACKKDEPM